MNMAVSPVFEVSLEPKFESSITHIIVRIDDPVNIDDSDKLIDFLEEKFPDYQIKHILGGYKQVEQ
jgi:hypothetical protein